MTNVIVNVKDFIENEKVESSYQTQKIDIILDFLKLKAISKKAKEEIREYVEKNNKIRNGKMVLKGTRITTKELLIIMSEYSETSDYKSVVDYITKQYPSIDSENKIVYGALYEIGKINTIGFIVKVLMNRK